MSDQQLVWQLTSLRKGTEGWESQQALMDTSSRELGGASASALPPSVQGAGTTFLSRWAGYAGESAAIAQGFVGALRATSDDYGTTDDATDRQFSDLDARLGSPR